MTVTELDPLLPAPVRDAYQIDAGASITRLTGGQVNETLLVDTGEQKSIVRRLAPVLGTAVLRDTLTVSQHLVQRGWEAPLPQETTSGELFVQDEAEQTWHSMHFIASDSTEAPATHTPTMAVAAGGLLGGWHASVRSLEYEPTFKIPHFHDTPFIAQHLEEELPFLPDRHARWLAQSLLDEHDRQSTIADDRQQIIHGDPKLANMLFKDGQPFTLIDFDCLMRDSVWTDVGDFMRSLMGKMIDSPELEVAVQQSITAYAAAGDTGLSADQVTHHALTATRRIANELGMRYLADISDGAHYFAGDADAAERRAAVLYEKAVLQSRVVTKAVTLLNLV